ncbi:HD domain-containing phosphohydrolase [Desulfosporosinus sp. BICA1-9]|uniref:HD domain-containing phosphohydrolase n=1 Tax=Desulfosporosinus sp. BICA1-9 TaxID=1531958 RepID=UPI000B322978|nr:HD domain-containing phosphohydrolase [Desulfosporosinus sp. BICA1-9]HBW38167.1 HD-GYP domain-containing protein [Desulfosporosinus sp.]
MNFRIRPLQAPSTSVGQASEQDLFDANGRLLLEKGKLISPEILQAIRKQEAYSVTSNWTNRPCMSLSKDHHKSLNLLNHLYDEINLIHVDYLSKGKVILNRVLIDMENGSFSFVNFSTLETYDKLTYIHSINVALLAVVIGMHMGYAQEVLHNLALGALLHDWGKLSVPSEILNKPSGLTLYEFDLIKQHPICGEQMLRWSKLPGEVVKVVRQHHERWDGQGYPDGLKGEDIHRNAQIVALADVFDALTEDRPYRRALPPYHALEMIFLSINKNFSPDVVHAFRNCLDIYPENSTVTLNIGEMGIVIAVSPGLPTRPTVLIYKQQGNQIEEKKIVDLRDDLALSIKAIDFDGSQMSKKMASQKISKIINGGFLKIEADIADDKGILNLSGVLDISAVEAFKSSLNSFEGINCLEINLGGITFVDSTGIGGIIEIVKKSKEQNMFVRYKNIPKYIFELFAILGVPDLCGKEAFEWLPE